MKLYIVLPNNQIGMIARVCSCEECKKRGKPEYQVVDLSGDYLDMLKPEELHKCFLTLEKGIAEQRVNLNQRSKELLIEFLEEMLITEMSVPEEYEVEIYERWINEPFRKRGV